MYIMRMMGRTTPTPVWRIEPGSDVVTRVRLQKPGSNQKLTLSDL